MLNGLDCNIVVSEFQLQSCLNILFRTNTFRKQIISFISQVWAKKYHYLPPTTMDLVLNYNKYVFAIKLRKQTKPNQITNL